MPEERASKESFTHNWIGLLTVQNAERVTELLRTLLTGKRFTFVAFHEGMEDSPRVKTSVTLDDVRRGEPAITCKTDGGDARISVCDTDGQWGVTTTLHDGAKPDERLPYFVFSRGQVKITQRTAGGKLTWVAAVEQPNDDSPA